MEMKRVEKTPSLMIRTTVPMEKLSETMGSAYGELAAYMNDRDIPFAGPPYALYRNMDMSALDVEMGFPVTSPAEGEGRIAAGEIPAGDVATELYEGSYEGIGTAYDRLKAFTEQQGRPAGEWCYEFYLNSPLDTPPEQLKTEIFFPLKG